MQATEISADHAEKLLSSIKIPPRPVILQEIMAETKKADPSLLKIAQLISKDIALSAAMLKLVNSPVFGLRRKIDSPQQAVMTLGVRNVTGLVTGLSLKSAFGQEMNLERFWDSADRVANISMTVAAKLHAIPTDMAYLHGLFRDCGMPIMMQKFPDYKDTLKAANAEKMRLFTKVEDERHSTNHAVVGYLLARSWGVADEICQAILNHHDHSLLDSGSNLPAASSGLIAVSCLAEYLSDYVRLRGDDQWNTNGAAVMDYLGIGPSELEDLKEEVAQEYAG